MGVVIINKKSGKYSDLSREYREQYKKREGIRRQEVTDGKDPEKHSGQWRKADNEMSRTRESLLEKVRDMKKGRHVE